MLTYLVVDGQNDNPVSILLALSVACLLLTVVETIEKKIIPNSF